MQIPEWEQELHLQCGHNTTGDCASASGGTSRHCFAKKGGRTWKNETSWQPAYPAQRPGHSATHAGSSCSYLSQTCARHSILIADITTHHYTCASKTNAPSHDLR